MIILVPNCIQAQKLHRREVQATNSTKQQAQQPSSDIKSVQNDLMNSAPDQIAWQNKVQKDIDTLINTINTTGCYFGVLVGLISLLIMVAVAFGVVGFLELGKIKRTRRRVETMAANLKETYRKTAIEVESIRNDAEWIGQIKEKLLKEDGGVKEYQVLLKKTRYGATKLEELNRSDLKVEVKELLGVPLSPRDHFIYGMKRLSLGQWAIAAEAFKKAAELGYEVIGALKHRGIALMAEGQADEAVNAFAQALAMEPNNADLWYHKGAALGKNKSLSEALTAFDKAASLDPSLTATTWYERGVVLEDANQNWRALKAYKKAIRLQPDFGGGWYNLGSLLMKIGRHKEAFTALEQATRLESDYTDAWIDKGKVLTSLNHLTGAASAFECAYRIQPDNAEAWYNHGLVQAKIGNHIEAFSDIFSAIRFDVSYKKTAAKAEELKDLWNNPLFKNLIL